MTYTPGPWAVDGPIHGPGRFKWVLAPTKGKKYILVAEVSPTGNDASHPTGNERDANARVIAAAPDLLAALRDIVENHPDSHIKCGWCGRWKNESCECDSDDCMGVQARAAIAKAQGNEKA